MNLYELFILSIALATDAALVSLSYGCIIRYNKIKYSILLAASFSLFQMIMPLLSTIFTDFLSDYLLKYSKAFTFTTFLILGLKFIKEGIDTKQKKYSDCISLLCLLSLALATSIDAFFAGIPMKLLNTNMPLGITLIGTITLILSFLGFYSGNIFSKFPSKYAEITGGILLLYLGIKTIL